MHRAWRIHSMWSIAVKYNGRDSAAKHVPLCHCRNIVSALGDLGKAIYDEDRPTALAIADNILNGWAVPKRKHWADRRTDLESFYNYGYYTPAYLAELDEE